MDRAGAGSPREEALGSAGTEHRGRGVLGDPPMPFATSSWPAGRTPGRSTRLAARHVPAPVAARQDFGRRCSVRPPLSRVALATVVSLSGIGTFTWSGPSAPRPLAATWLRASVANAPAPRDVPLRGV